MEPVHSITDEELACRARAGSLEAFEALVWRYEARIFRFALMACHGETTAREITQDTFVKAYQALGQLQSDRQFRPWLFTIARRLTTDHFRYSARFTDTPPPELALNRTPADQLAEAEEKSRLWSRVREVLSPPQFEAVWLRYAESLSIHEIACVLGKSQTNVKVLLFRARFNLMRALDREEFHFNEPAATSPALPKTPAHPLFT